MLRPFLALLFCLATLRAEPFPAKAKVSKASGSVIKGKTSIQTGTGAKAELDLLDGSLVRVGANAKFSFTPGTREAKLDNGTMLFSSPKDGVTIKTAGVTTTATGAVDFEAANFGGNVKVICLSGKPVVSLAGNPKGKALKPGQMLSILSGATSLPKSDIVDLKVLLETGGLMKMGTLPSQTTLNRNAGKQGAKLPISLPGGASNEIATARTMQLAEAQQLSIQQQQAAQQAALVAQEQEAARQLARQQFVTQQQAQQLAAQQAAAKAAQEVARQQQLVAQQQAANQGGGPQGNQGQGPQGNQGVGNQGQGNSGNQGKKPNVPPGQNKP